MATGVLFDHWNVSRGREQAVQQGMGGRSAGPRLDAVNDSCCVILLLTDEWNL